MRHHWHVATAAEAFAAGQFARYGWDVSVQYGANQPEYDLTVANHAHMLKVSVKGSKHAGWGLTQSHLQGADYQAAADAFVARHSAQTILCLVTFKDVATDALPRMYLATPVEIAAWLKRAAAGRGDTVLYEHHAWTSRSQAAGTVDEIPPHWWFTPERLELLAGQTEQTLPADGTKA